MTGPAAAPRSPAGNESVWWFHRLPHWAPWAAGVVLLVLWLFVQCVVLGRPLPGLGALRSERDLERASDWFHPTGDAHLARNVTARVSYWRDNGSGGVDVGFEVANQGNDHIAVELLPQARLKDGTVVSGDPYQRRDMGRGSANGNLTVDLKRTQPVDVVAARLLADNLRPAAAFTH